MNTKKLMLLPISYHTLILKMNKSLLLYYNFLGINMLGSYLQRGMPNRICKYIVCEIIDGKKVTNISQNNYFKK